MVSPADGWQRNEDVVQSILVYSCLEYTSILLSRVYLYTRRIQVLWHCWLGDSKGKKLGVGLLVVTFRLELCTSYSSSCHHSPPPSSLAPIKSTMETFWYHLTQVHLENGCNDGYRDVYNEVICLWLVRGWTLCQFHTRILHQQIITISSETSTGLNVSDLQMCQSQWNNSGRVQ